MANNSAPILWSKPGILQAISEFFVTHKVWPRHKQFTGSFGLPSPRSVYRFWPSIAVLIAEASVAYQQSHQESVAKPLPRRRPPCDLKLIAVDGTEIPLPQDFLRDIVLPQNASKAEIVHLVRLRLWTWQGPLGGIVERIEWADRPQENSIDSVSGGT